MSNNRKANPGVGIVVLLLILINALLVKIAFIKDANLYWLLIITVPLLLLAMYGGKRKKAEKALNRDRKSFDQRQTFIVYQRAEHKAASVSLFRN